MNNPNTDLERGDRELVEQAVAKLGSDIEAAKKILLQVIKNAPSPGDYIYEYEDDLGWYIILWDRKEFAHYCEWLKGQGESTRNKPLFCTIGVFRIPIIIPRF